MILNLILIVAVIVALTWARKAQRSNEQQSELIDKLVNESGRQSELIRETRKQVKTNIEEIAKTREIHKVDTNSIETKVKRNADAIAKHHPAKRRGRKPKAQS